MRAECNHCESISMSAKTNVRTLRWSTGCIKKGLPQF